MAKFEEYLNSSSFTFSDLTDATKRKVERFENLYQAYSDAYDAEDYKTSDKYEKQLETLDSEIKGLIESQYKPAKAERVEVKAEEPKTEEPKAEEVKVEEPKTEEPKAEEVKVEEPKAEELKPEEVKAEEPKAEEPKKAGFNIGMFEI